MQEPSRKPRGRILTSEALDRLEKAFIRRFPRLEFPKLYERSSHSYNFQQIQKAIQAECEESIDSGTLKKIFWNEKGVDLSSLEKIFKVVDETLNETDHVERTSLFITPLERAQLPTQYCTLPSQDYAKFIGRTEELKALLGYLAHEKRAYIISIDGIGGVGKTSLAVQAAYLCWQAKHSSNSGGAPAYDAIVFTTFKTHILSSSEGLLPTMSKHTTLRDIFASIALTLNEDSIHRATPSEQLSLVRKCLEKQKTLLIIDDFHSSSEEEQKHIMSFLEDLPHTTKAIITTRKRRLGRSHIRLECLSKEEGIELINQQLKQRDREEEISLEHKEQLYQCFLGIPIALVYAIGQLDNGYKIEEILGCTCPRIRDEVAQFCFNNIIRSIKEKHSFDLLKAIAIFDFPPVHNAVVYVANLDCELQANIVDAIAELKRLALIHEQKSEKRYVMLSVTREYVLAYPKSLDKDKILDEQRKDEDLNERKIKWYLDFTKKHGGFDLGDWRDQYDWIQGEWENILSVINWCASLIEYSKVKELWNNVNHFTDLYGYWVDRITWLDWLAKNALDRKDWETYILSLARKSWTLTMMGQDENLVQAKELIDKAYEKRKYANLCLQDYLCHNAAVLLTRQKLYREARDILDEKEKLVAQIHTNGLEQDKLLARRQMNTERDFAKIDYEEGKLDDAKKRYQAVLAEANRINWKRIACYTQNMLANIAIRQGNLEEAEFYLGEGIQIAEYNRNKRRKAYYLKSFADLEKKRGNLEKACAHARAAIELFRQIRMEKEVEAIQLSFNL